jgi:hypothetical protein
MKRIFIFSSMAIAAGLAVANTYNSIVDVPAWGNHIPDSLAIARQYYSASNPGDFFRIFSPINQALGLLCVLLFWKGEKGMRRFLIAAFVLYVIGEGMTFKFFYPRNDIMFKGSLSDADTLKATWEQWKNMNWVRTLVIAAGFVCSSLALHYSYVATISVKFRRDKRADQAAVAG